MKYIRMKDDSIFEIIKDKIKGTDIAVEFLYNNNEKRIFYAGESKYILKQADTIQELCDEFICIDIQNKEYRPLRFYFLDDLYNFIKQNDLFRVYKVYGAIWTNKGLIYVAKVNSKGELELL